MGLGRLNPGCRQDCGCGGCFGSIQLIGNCEVRWTTIGDPAEVEVLRDGVLISTATSGSIYSPPSGLYTLRIKCTSSGEFVLADSLTVAVNTSTCVSCCQTMGQIPNFNHTIQANIEFGGQPWDAFNGIYTLRRFGSCASTIVCTYSTLGYCGNTSVGIYPLGPPGNYSQHDPATKVCSKIPGANLFTNGVLIGTYTQTIAVWGTAVYEAWQFPTQVICNVYFGDWTYRDGMPIFVPGNRMFIELSATAPVYYVAISGRRNFPGECSFTDQRYAACYTFGAPCGNATLASPPEPPTYSNTDNPPRSPLIWPTSMRATIVA